MSRQSTADDLSFSGIRSITSREFQQLSTYIREHTGIHLTESKRALLVGRLTRRLRALGLDTFGAYHKYLVANPDLECPKLVDRMTTNETAFFREPAQFEYLSSEVFPAWRREVEDWGGRRSIRAWSAGCATGEEPYSLAMTLLENFPSATGWSLEVWATDLSNEALDAARAGMWTAERAAAIPPDYAKRYMLRGTGSQAGMVKAGASLRSIIRFRQLNLSRPPFPSAEPFDLIFCRNVLIYFDRELRLRVVDHLVDRLSPRGLLLLGHAESLFGQTGRVRGLIPSVYSLRDGATRGTGS